MAITGHTLTLGWQDFQGQVPSGATHDAFTSTSFSVNTPFAFSVNGNQRTNFRLTGVTVTVTLNRPQMWSVTSAQTASLLTHEQGHYEITALLMRDLHTDLEALRTSGQTFATQQLLEQAVDSLKQPIVSLHTRLQSTATTDGVYDRQTNHSATTAVQAQYNAAFSAARTAGTRLAAALTAQGITVP